MTILINTNIGIVAMAGQYLKNINNDVSPTDLFSLSRSKLSSKFSKSKVRPSARQVSAKLTDAFRYVAEHDFTQPESNEIDKHLNLIASIHFLPVLLIDASETIIQSGFSRVEYNTINPVFLKRITELSNHIIALRSEIVINNLGLVKYLAHQYHPQNMTQNDILHEGFVGLLKAVDRFDHRRKLCFSTYATYWIQQAIMRSLSKNDKLVRIPINLSPKAPLVFQMVNSHLIESGCVPNASILAQQCKLSEHEVSTILLSCRPTISLDQEDENNIDATFSLLNFMEQHQFSSAEESVSESELKEMLKQAINSLSEKEACVIRCRFGLESQSEMTLQNIADCLQVTRERVRQIQNTGLDKLRCILNSQMADYLKTS